jgi:sirohydrochlorin ferrochelatase
VRLWLDEAKANGVKPPVKAAELSITRVLSVRGNSAAGAEAKIDTMLHDLALGDENNQNVCALLEFFDEDKAKQGKKLQVLQQVVRQTVAGIVLSKAQILRFTKKKKARGKKPVTATVGRQTFTPTSGVSAGA